MTTATGAAFLISGGAILGLAAVKRLNDRAKTLASLVSAMDYLHAEVKFGLTPLPDVMRKLAFNYPGLFFSRCEKQVTPENGFSGIWKSALKETRLPLRPEELQALEELGNVLGRFEAGAQENAITLAKERLRASHITARDEQMSKSRLFGFLGAALGAVTAILLI